MKLFNKTKDKVRVITVDPMLHDKIKKYASVRGQKIGWVANDALHKYLMKNDTNS